MAKVHTQKLSIYVIKQFSDCCHGNIFTTAMSVYVIKQFSDCCHGNIFTTAMSIYVIKQFSDCCHGNIFTTTAKIFSKFRLAHYIHQPNLRFKALMILELVISNYFLKMSLSYPGTSFPNNKPRNLNKGYSPKSLSLSTPSEHIQISFSRS